MRIVRICNTFFLWKYLQKRQIGNQLPQLRRAQSCSYVLTTTKNTTRSYFHVGAMEWAGQMSSLIGWYRSDRHIGGRGRANKLTK